MWVENITAINLTGHERFLDWMQKPYHMGNALRKVCDVLSVKILEQKFTLPLENEHAHLGISKENDLEKTCYVRSIILAGDGIPFCYGRVLAPVAVYIKYQEEFQSLDTKLIGETLLYNNPKTQRSAFEYSLIKKNVPLYQIVKNHLGDECCQSDLCARRSLFLMNGIDPLLITEIFLQDIPDYQG